MLEEVCERPRDEIAAALAEAVDARLIAESAEEPGQLLVRPRARARDPARRDPRGPPRGRSTEIAEALERACADDDSTRTSASSPTTSSRRPRWATPIAPSTTPPGPGGRRSAASPTRRRPSLYAKALEALDARRLGATPSAGSSCCSRSARRRPAPARPDRGARVARGGRRTWPASSAAPRSWRRRRWRSACSRRPGTVDEPLIALLEEALEAVGEEDSPLRSQLLSGLAQELYWVDAAGRSNELGLEALEMARRVGDPQSLALALIRRQFTGGVGHDETQRRLRESTRAARPRQAAGRPRARGARARLPAARLARARRDRARSTASWRPTSGSPTSCASRPSSGTCRCCAAMRALIDGRFADCRGARGGGARRRASARRSRWRRCSTRSRSTLLRRLRRSPDDVARSPRRRSRSSASSPSAIPAIPAWRCSLAAATPSSATAARRGRCSSRSPRDDFADLPLDAQWVISLALLAETAVFLERRAARASASTSCCCPYDGLTIVAGRAAACYGPVARVLGLLAADRRPPRGRRAPPHRGRSR